MTRYEKAMLNDMVDYIFKGFAIGLPAMLIGGSIWLTLALRALG